MLLHPPPSSSRRWGFHLPSITYPHRRPASRRQVGVLLTEVLHADQGQLDGWRRISRCGGDGGEHEQPTRPCRGSLPDPAGVSLAGQRFQVTAPAWMGYPDATTRPYRGPSFLFLSRNPRWGFDSQQSSPSQHSACFARVLATCGARRLDQDGAVGPVPGAWRPVWVLLSGSGATTGLIGASPSFPPRLRPTCVVQLVIDTSNSHVGHKVARFISIRDPRATFLAASSSSGIGSLVSKYISSGV